MDRPVESLRDDSLAHLPSQSCRFARRLTARLINPPADLDGMAFGFCCDAIKATADILADQAPLPIIQFNMPTRTTGPAARAYLRGELESFKNKLEQLTGRPIRDGDLAAAMEVFRTNRRLLRRLADLRRTRPDLLSAGDHQALIMAGFSLPKADHNRLLENFLTLAEATAPPDRTGPRPKKVILSGFLGGDLTMIDRLESHGLELIADDLCEGGRGLPPAGTIDPAADPLDRIAARLTGLWCPVKEHRPGQGATRLIRLARENRADGIVFFIYQFCDPLGLDYAIVKQDLDRAGPPHLILEPAPDADRIGQTETRLEAFLENL